eukprot:CAMPEP_0170416382 /NCGR_PEP_ID=MMETSP0117_2-20130122/33128_1 /TAXON_ID=400756 /ORGANISM="Durinskia baltica, Strain CSIRO CS-38" /LENGTH=95 /DNA_ID=CAMNT_0010674447 /DNA_START=98 /DNA_END=382 /DNA_ORIENTATION=+
MGGRPLSISPARKMARHLGTNPPPTKAGVKPEHIPPSAHFVRRAQSAVSWHRCRSEHGASHACARVARALRRTAPARPIRVRDLQEPPARHRVCP